MRRSSVMKSQKCCAHCPGKLVAPGTNESHECCQPKYVSGNLKIPSLTRHVSKWPERKDSATRRPLSEDRSTCCDNFALAKKLHAENLEHQPLPDKVDDSVFKNVASKRFCRCISSGKRCDCCNNDVEDSKYLDRRCGSVLGCKKPRTKMDLAICWETPVDPIYEPLRPTHVDGSEGGPAPAIFTLVQHTSSSRASLRPGSIRSSKRKDEGCQADLDQSQNENEKDHGRNECCCECLCKDFNRVNISKKNQGQERLKRGSFRKCVACESKGVTDDPRLIKSAVGLTLGLEKSENDQRGSHSKVPRPKTPFAKRSFRIDTLSPPFSVVKGRRDTDYPEHWRLMSVYQQSYKNPYRRRNLCRC